MFAYIFIPLALVSRKSYACLTQWEKCTISGVLIRASRTVIGCPLGLGNQILILRFQMRPNAIYRHPQKFCTCPVAVTPSQVQQWQSASFLSDQKPTV